MLTSIFEDIAWDSGIPASKACMEMGLLIVQFAITYADFTLRREHLTRLERSYLPTHLTCSQPPCSCSTACQGY
jgi:hypothetical protein